MIDFLKVCQPVSSSQGLTSSTIEDLAMSAGSKGEKYTYY